MLNDPPGAPPFYMAAADVIRLTGKKRWTAQRRALDKLKIAYRLSARGEPLVKQSSIDNIDKERRPHHGPRWDRL